MTLGAFSQRRWLLSSLLIAGAALFAVGVAAERSVADNHAASRSEATHTDESAKGEANHIETSKETVFGVDLESTALVIVAAIASLTLAVLTWRINARPLLLATIAFAGVFAAFDASELLHQVKESRAGIAALAAVIAVLHITTAFVAEQRAAASPA